MERPKAKPSRRRYWKSSEVLENVQAALKHATKTRNEALQNKAESVLSALVVVLRHEKIVLPEPIQDMYLDLIGDDYGTPD